MNQLMYQAHFDRSNVADSSGSLDVVRVLGTDVVQQNVVEKILKKVCGQTVGLLIIHVDRRNHSGSTTR